MTSSNVPFSSVILIDKSIYKKIKRLFDVTASLSILLVLFPLLIVIFLFNLRDGGPSLFAHQRIGLRGTPFNCLKFRTMCVDADDLLAKLLETNSLALQEWQANRKLRSDPRVTKFGRILRSTSLDELPQLLNVLWGDMSLVGPRPVTQNELDLYYEPNCARLAYISVRPGITGPWQIGGRSELSYSTRVALDRKYAEQQSLRTDILILLRTVNVVMKRTGAH